METALLRVDPADGVSWDDAEILKKSIEVSELELDHGGGGLKEDGSAVAGPEIDGEEGE
jgi:hypothetical protein